MLGQATAAPHVALLVVSLRVSMLVVTFPAPCLVALPGSYRHPFIISLVCMKFLGVAFIPFCCCVLLYHGFPAPVKS